MWRCVSDKFGYCSGEPEWEVEPSFVKNKNYDLKMISEARGGVCKNSPGECKKYRTHAQTTEMKIVK